MDNDLDALLLLDTSRQGVFGKPMFPFPLSETETFMDRPQTMFGSCFHHHCLLSQVLHDVHRREFPRNSRYIHQLR